MVINSRRWVSCAVNAYNILFKRYHFEDSDENGRIPLELNPKKQTLNTQNGFKRSVLVNIRVLRIFSFNRIVGNFLSSKVFMTVTTFMSVLGLTSLISLSKNGQIMKLTNQLHPPSSEI